ncbi:MAG: SDR family oxidoreductase [Actinomycetota bacterium]
MGRLDDKIAVVVGGASGFGLATAERFGAEGATVAILGRRLDAATEVAERLGGTAHVCDVTDHAKMNAATDAVVAAHGRIDIGVNYAGFEQSTPIKELTPEVWQPMVDVQLTGAVWFIQAMGRAMADGGGSIVSTSSLTAANPSVGQAAYAGSKAGLEYITRIAALEYGPDDIRVNCVAPHLIETPMTSRIFEMDLIIEAVRLQTPLGRMGSIDDIANTVLFLASDEAAYITGQTLYVDGGASTQKLPAASELGMLAALQAARAEGPAGD